MQRARWRMLAVNLGLALVYLAAARAALLLSHPDIRISAVWWPSGIALALALRYGWRVVPGIALGDLAAGLSFGNPPAAALAVAAGGVAEAMLGSHLLRRHAGPEPEMLRSTRGATLFIVLGALVSPMASAAFGVPALIQAGIVGEGQWLRAAAIWWTGDVIGILILYPVVSALLEPATAAHAMTDRRGVPAMLALAGATALLFLVSDANTFGREALPFLLYPLAVIGALRMGVRTAGWTYLAVAGIALGATVLGRGPFAVSGGANDVWLLQAFVMAMTVTILVIVAASYDLRSAVLRERQSELLARTRSEMLATMSHEVRTPMNGLLGMLELLARGPLAPQQQEMLTLARRSGSHLLRMVNDVLQGARLEAGHIDVVVGPVDLASLCEMVAEQMAPQAQSKGLALLMTVAPDLARAHVTDQARVSQILFNLVSNAIKFTQHGVVRVVVQAKASAEGKQTVVIAVSDTGQGITEGDIPKLFQPYSRLGADVGRAQEGAGLGLFICRRLAQALGGEIRVNSEPGVGTTFALELPLPVATPAANEPALHNLRVGIAVPDERLAGLIEATVQAHGGQALREPSAGASPDVLVAWSIGNADVVSSWSTPPSRQVALVNGRADESTHTGRALGTHPLLPSRLVAALRAAAARGSGDDTKPTAASPVAGAATGPGGLRVLVADDDPVNRVVIQGQLQALGHHPTSVTGGEAAWQAWLDGSFDLLLTDIMMPGLDGCTLVKRIREREKADMRRSIPVIAITADGSESSRARAHEAGMTGHLLKPFDLPALGDAIARTCARD